MPRIHDFVPPPADALELPLNELALRLLRFQVATEDQDGRMSFNLCVNRSHFGEYEPMGDAAGPFLRALTEAKDWLYLHGLVASVNPDQRHDSEGSFVTRRGRAFLEDHDGLARLHAERRLEVELHPIIAERVQSQWILGEYEAARVPGDA